MNMGTILEKATEKFAGKKALILDDRELSFAELNEVANRVGNALRAGGVEKGDRVALLLPNRLESIASFYAIMKIGAVINPLNPLFRGREIKYILNNSGAKVLVTTADQMKTIEEVRPELPSLERVILVDSANYPKTDFLYDFIKSAPPTLEMEDCDPDHPLFLVYTSGTTGLPKGATVTHRNSLANAQLSAQVQFFTQHDLIITALPVFHLFGGNVVLSGSIIAGSTLCVLGKFDPRRMLERIDAIKANMFVGVPTMFVSLNREARPGEGQSLERVITAGAPMPLEVMREVEQKFRAQVIELYGLTETAGVVTCNPMYYPAKPGSVGLPIPPVRVKIVDAEGPSREVGVGQIGELCVRGPVVMKEYWKMPKETEETIVDGWLHTGDLAEMDEEGFIYLKGRKKEMIIVGGYNVYPVEIEDAIYEHPAVSEVAVVGVPDEKMGEIPKAFVVLRPGAEATPGEITAHCDARLAKFKVPRRVEFISEIPKNPVGKILKRVLREREQTKG